MLKATVLAVSEGKNPNNILLTVLLQNNSSQKKRKYEVTPEDYERLDCPVTGCELSEYECKILFRSTHEKDALSSAYRILAHCDNNAASLKRKLIDRGFGEEIAEKTVEKMVSLGYINEHDQLLRFVLRLANQNLYGERKIYPYLISRGYKKEDIEDAISELTDQNELDFENVKERLLSEKGAGCADRSKIKALLYKYGHGSSFDF